MQAPAPANKLHPLIATAAIAVTAFSVLGAVVLITNQVSAQHAAAPAPAVAVAAPASTDATPAQATPAATPPAAPAQRPTAAVSNRTHAARGTAPRARSANPQVAEASPAPYAAPPPDAATPPPIAMTPAVAPPPICTDCGTVISVRAVSTPGEGSGIGAVAGGVLGGVIGNQFGRGSGKDATRILGAIGGAIAGHQIEKQVRTTSHYDVTVRMDDGSTRTLTRTTDPGLSTGARVRVDGDELRVLDAGATTRGPTPMYTAAPGNG